MKIDVSELRKERRPLWMTEFDEESTADILGGGGDLYADRVPAEWARDTGIELTGEEYARLLMEGEYVEEDYIS